jgi:hypothetical protein
MQSECREREANLVLKKFKCLIVSEDEFEEIPSYNKEMQYIEKNNDDGETIWKDKRISGHEGPLNKNHSSWRGDQYNDKVEWENGEVSYEPLHMIAADDPVMCGVYAKDHGLLDIDGLKPTGLIEFHLRCNFFCDKEGVSYFAPRKYINKLIASYERMFGSRLKTNKITSSLVKGDHPEIDDSIFLEEEGIQQYQPLIRQLQWDRTFTLMGVSFQPQLPTIQLEPAKGFVASGQPGNVAVTTYDVLDTYFTQHMDHLLAPHRTGVLVTMEVRRVLYLPAAWTPAFIGGVPPREAWARAPELQAPMEPDHQALFERIATWTRASCSKLGEACADVSQS